MVTPGRINCWEYMRCGRESGGLTAERYGECPAAVDMSYDGINSGRCAGRFCWAVAGTLCGERIQGSFAEKRDTCTSCDFYLKVQAEEGTTNLRRIFMRFLAGRSAHCLFHQENTRSIPKGRRFIHQGQKGNKAYVIQNGACIEIVKKNGQLHPVGHRGAGDIVGLVSLMTGEVQLAHVEAETPTDVWVIEKADLKKLFHSDREMLAFLSELVASRFDRKRPMAERTIGEKYVATEILDRGGCSIVYRARHTGLNMPVAVKMMRHDLVIRPEFLDTFRNEARLIASLSHENIVRVFDIEERLRTIFIVMEFMEGESLRQLLQRLGRIPPELAGWFMHQVCAALAYAHDKGIVHRDVNPGNIFILQGHRVKLIDFGLAYRKGSDEHFLDGTLAYQAPELLTGEPADENSDIYAAGVTAYELVTGQLPHSMDHVAAFMQSRREEEIPDPAKEVPELPEALGRFIRKACRRDARRRYTCAHEALDDLKVYENSFRTPVFNNRAKGDMMIETPAIRIFGKTHAGLRMTINEDCYRVFELAPREVLIALADGLGGHVCGKEAATFICEAFIQAAPQYQPDSHVDLRAFVEIADLTLHHRTQRESGKEGMGTTFIGLHINGDTVKYVHCGDSRLYRYRQHQLAQLTEDQTLFRFLRREGELSMDTPRNHYSRQVLDQYVGCGFSEPQKGEIALFPGDVLMLCTDGLYKHVPDRHIRALLKEPVSLAQKCDGFIRAALDAGGRDNVTVILVEKTATSVGGDLSS